MARTKDAKTICVAAYCRVSVAEREQSEFGSLAAQREAIEAFVQSQREMGWIVLDDRYDDEGISGGTLERPALQRLLADARAGKIDVLAVYKFDRLSRRQIDFLGLIEELEALGVQFVSITQNLDTSTSMGRCMLNVMSAFAQLEREVIAERTRDKMQAARRKGMWTGGRPVLGYDVVDKKLEINPSEAETVRGIFELYLDLGGCGAVAEELRLRGIRNKAWTNAKGKPAGGGRFNKNTVHALLTNATYIGKIRAAGEIYDGEHERIIEDALWESVQRKLSLRSSDASDGAGVASQPRTRRPSAALLAGIAVCHCGAAMTPTHTTHGTKRYAYYACSRAQKSGSKACPKSRVAQGKLDAFVIKQLRRVGQDPAVIVAALEADADGRQLEVARVRAHLAEVREARARLVRERSRLIDAVGEGDAGDGILARVHELDEQVRAIDERLNSAERDLEALTVEETDPTALAAALAEFNGVWDALKVEERGRALDLLLEDVVYDGRTDDIELIFRPVPAGTSSEEAA